MPVLACPCEALHVPHPSDVSYPSDASPRIAPALVYSSAPPPPKPLQEVPPISPIIPIHHQTFYQGLQRDRAGRRLRGAWCRRTGFFPADCIIINCPLAMFCRFNVVTRSPFDLLRARIEGRLGTHGPKNSTIRTQVSNWSRIQVQKAVARARLVQSYAPSR